MVGDYRICSELTKKKEPDHKSPEFVYQASSHNFLSVIFGILGKFGIEIGTRKKVGRKQKSSKKNENFLSKIIWEPKIFDFCSKKKIVEKINENSKFQNFENFSKF